MASPVIITIQKSHTEEDEIQNLLKKEFLNSQIKIHFDYCVHELCKFCDYQKCEFRKAVKSVVFNWDEEKLTGKSVYMLERN